MSSIPSPKFAYASGLIFGPSVRLSNGIIAEPDWTRARLPGKITCLIYSTGSFQVWRSGLLWSLHASHLLVPRDRLMSESQPLRLR